jgi:hypothetical protein
VFGATFIVGHDRVLETSWSFPDGVLKRTVFVNRPSSLFDMATVQSEG